MHPETDQLLNTKHCLKVVDAVKLCTVEMSHNLSRISQTKAAKMQCLTSGESRGLTLLGVICRCNDLPGPEPPTLYSTPSMRCSLPGSATPEFRRVRVGRLGLFSERADNNCLANTAPLDCSLDVGVAGTVKEFDVCLRTSCSFRLCVDLT